MSAPIYKSYMFKDKDPVIDRLRTLFQDNGITNESVQEAGGPKAATLRAWFEGKTLRPQHATLNAALRTTGHEFTITPISFRTLKKAKTNSKKRGSK